MNCKKAQELMLTDYLDGEMGEKEKAAIEKHFGNCQGCREFSITAKRVGNGLFLDADRAEVPEYLWRRVRETILAEGQKRKSLAAAIFDKFKGIIYIPKPALAIATIVVLVLAIGTATTIKINNQTAMNAEYLDYLSDTTADNPINDNGNFGTSIEKYFM